MKKTLTTNKLSAISDWFYGVSISRLGFSLSLIVFVLIPTACSLLPESLFREEVGIRILLESTVRVDDATMQVTRDIIEHRINDLSFEGLIDASVSVSGNRIIIELTVDEDDEMFVSDIVLDTVSSLGLLEFVDFTGIPSSIGVGNCIATTEQTRILAEMQVNDEDFQMGDDCIPIGVDGTPNGPPFTTVMTGSGLDDVQAVIEPNGTRWQIAFTLNEEGNKIFGDHTAANIGQRMAIVLNGVVVSAPVINARIVGEGVIQGTFTRDEAESLAAQLRFGTLPVPLEVIAYDVVALE
jgi:preprotein translocase subunit SecD